MTFSQTRETKPSADGVSLLSNPPHTCSEVDHRGCAGSDGIHLGVDLML